MNKGSKARKAFAMEDELTRQNGWEYKGPGVGLCSVHSGSSQEARIAEKSEPRKRSQRGDQNEGEGPDSAGSCGPLAVLIGLGCHKNISWWLTQQTFTSYSSRG